MIVLHNITICGGLSLKLHSVWFLQAVYNKDDFFDSISCNSLDNDPNNGRTRYSEQMKLDTEVVPILILISLVMSKKCH